MNDTPETLAPDHGLAMATTTLPRSARDRSHVRQRVPQGVAPGATLSGTFMPAHLHAAVSFPMSTSGASALSLPRTTWRAIVEFDLLAAYLE